MGNPYYRAVWIELLLTAQRQDGYKVRFKGKSILLKKGQLTCGAIQLAEKTGVKRGTVERVLQRMKSEEQIEVQTSNKCSLVTILNWSIYQNDEEQIEEQMRNKRGTDEEQMRTKQEVKKLRSKEEEKCSESEEKSSPLKTPDIILLHEELLLENYERNESFKGLISNLCDKGYSESVVEQELHKFVSYWRETNHRGKEKWQGQKFFEVKRRLATWFSNVKQPKQEEWQISTF